MPDVSVNLVPGATHVAEIVLGRDDSLNALSVSTSRELVRAARELATYPDVRAVVLRSSVERAFAAGADLGERLKMDEAALIAVREESRRATRSLLEVPIPLIADVHGYVLGGGLELALTCDLIVADDSAVFGFPETGIGITPGGGGTALIVDRVGFGAASDLIYTGRRIDAAEALRIKLVDRLVAPGMAMKAALDLARLISTRGPGAVRHAKASLAGGRGSPVHDWLELEDQHWRAAAVSAEYREGLQSFAEKRTPTWARPLATEPDAS